MNNPTKSLVIAGLSGGSGKSVVSVGLTGALCGNGHRVITYKKGPDYIDAGWLTTGSGSPCYNLDPYLMKPEAISRSFYSHLEGYDYALIEGNRGLYDGVNPEGGFSTAELAISLDIPVLLVVNCTKTTRTVAAMVLGCLELDKRLSIAGVILNRIATARHESIIRQAVERYTGVPVLGIVPKMKKDIFPMRHLGVTPHQEYDGTQNAMDELATLARDNFDLDAIDRLMKPLTPAAYDSAIINKPASSSVKIGIIRDQAFQFYYEENLEALRNGGAELVTINAINATQLPDDLDALYIGGGFPETSAAALAENNSFRQSVRQNAAKGLPIYAECGGLIYLGRSIVIDNQEYPLTDVFPITFGISEKPQAHGYSTFIVDKENPFYPIGLEIKGHEFRYSTITNWEGKSEDLTLEIKRGTGFQDKRDGLCKNNVLALYTHVLAPGTPAWSKGLIAAAEKYRHSKTN
ncbi:MAG: cobyrinate a,c-diamide synthase [Desulfobulbaceae bacterium]|nr:cobyrinate a,c-diamide synthase [Desulfobulbaceae bacterium]